MPFGNTLVDVFVGGGSGVMHMDYNIGRFTCIVNRLLLWASLLRFIVNRYNSDFPYTVFAALPLVLVTGKTGKVFFGEFVYMVFRRAASYDDSMLSILLKSYGLT